MTVSYTLLYTKPPSELLLKRREKFLVARTTFFAKRMFNIVV